MSSKSLLLRTCIAKRPIVTAFRRTYVAASPQTTPPPPSPEDLRSHAARGMRFTPEQVSEISRREQIFSPDGQQSKKGPGATAQSILTKQRQLDDKLEELSELPLDEITEKDVGELQSAMTKGRGGKPIEKDNVVSDLHRVAQTNEGIRMDPVEVSFDGISTADKAEVESYEMRVRGDGKIKKGGLAAQVQSAADRRENLHQTVTGAAITKEDAADLQRAEMARTPDGTIEKGGIAATAQSLADKQEYITEKAIPDVTKEDAAELQSIETKLTGGTQKGGVAAQTQSLADKKESI